MRFDSNEEKLIKRMHGSLIDAPYNFTNRHGSVKFTRAKEWTVKIKSIIIIVQWCKF